MRFDTDIPDGFGVMAIHARSCANWARIDRTPTTARRRCIREGIAARGSELHIDFLEAAFG
jgi:hypothetical protein